MAQSINADDSLASLLSRCALKEQVAFEQLYKMTSAKLFAVALRVLQRRDWAEDVLQESFVNIWHHAQDYQAQKVAPYTRMTHIVRNRALDWLRRPQHEVVMDEADWENAWADPAASLFEQLSLVRAGASLPRYGRICRVGCHSQRCRRGQKCDQSCWLNHDRH